MVAARRQPDERPFDIIETLPLAGPDGFSELTFRPPRLVGDTSLASRKIRQCQVRAAKFFAITGGQFAD